MADKKNEVAATKTAEVIQFDPTMFEADAGAGLENMGQEDLALPFLKVLGGMSKELDHLEDARKGDIYNSVTGAVLKGRRAYKSFRVPTSVGSSNGPPEAKERALPWLSTYRVKLCQKRSGLPKITKSI